jgi:pantoate--beta-alanine ligase
VLRFETSSDFRSVLDAARREGRSIGLVPTMGALHEGHRSLIERARVECDLVAVTIFVNPTQFSDPDDIANYPRPLARDLELCESAGVSVVFEPAVRELYPDWPNAPTTTVRVAGVSERWEGASRPGHFDGVATVVTKLFTIAGPCRAYFGEKDYQQLQVVNALVRDLRLPVEIIGCETVRELDGLALSSRNIRLSPDERVAATVLSRALSEGQRVVLEGARHPSALEQAMAAVVGTESLVQLDYACAVDATNLSTPSELNDGASYRLLIAARVGPVRLIDNCALVVPATRDRSGVEAQRQSVGAR